MKLTSLSIRNYRTIEALDLTFPVSYAALCGPNDSGKTNVIRAVRTVMREDMDHFRVGFDGRVSVKNDYPKWMKTPPDERTIRMALELQIEAARDAALFQFLIRQLQLEGEGARISLGMEVTYLGDQAIPNYSVTAEGRTFNGLEAQEVFKRFQSSPTILFHNSPQNELARSYREGIGSLSELSGASAAALSSLRQDMQKGLQRIAKSQQLELERLLGRLETKYKVGLSVPSFDLGWLPFNLTLGDSKHHIPLDSWGSGTQNRTLILRTLFRAKQIGESEQSSDKITPLIVIEEPESFLHPYAQAEFGRVIQDLAEEFDVQVLVTTHSPYLLSMKHPESNILLSRRQSYGQPRETHRVASEGDDWMAPFGQALGMNAEEFKPWRSLFRSESNAVLLVEGQTDKAYFEMLRDSAHGKNALKFDGEIIPYDGANALKNAVLMRFIRDRYKRLFVTFDLDVRHDVQRCLEALNLKEGVDYLAIGIDAAGKRSIEGLLPEDIRASVHSSDPDLVMAGMSNNKEEREQARSELKKRYLAAFTAAAKPGLEHYGALYKVAKSVNQALG